MAEFVDWAWRQGAFLPASANSLVEPDATGDRFVVTPYTCAIVRPTADTVVDLLRLRSIDRPDGNLRHGKSLRKLHLCADANGTQQWFEAIVAGRHSVPASALADLSPDQDLALSEDERRALAYWMSARFTRSAFPDDFVEAWRPQQAAIRSLMGGASRIEAVLVDMGPRGDGRYSPGFTLVVPTAKDVEAVATIENQLQVLLNNCPKLLEAEVRTAPLDAVSLAEFRSAMHFDAMDDLSIRDAGHAGPLV